MVLNRADGSIEHRIFRDLPDFLRPADCLVINTTKVLPARFEARRATGGRIEGLFLEELSPGTWRILLAGIGRLREGEALQVIARRECVQPHPDPPLAKGREYSLTLVRRLERGEAEVRITPAEPAAIVLDQIGTMPLPPYIRRAGEDSSKVDAADRSDYQTVYASQPGAVAAPTAGLHFTPSVLERVRESGAHFAETVLHVGLGTFQPIEVEDLADHRMHREWYCLPAEAAETVKRARASGGRVIAVGTTSVRVLETVWHRFPTGESLAHSEGWTDIFIYPPYEFRAVDALITNFHLPGSTLLALVCAFAGRDLVTMAYRSAIDAGYRFYSYGDAMLIV